MDETVTELSAERVCRAVDLLPAEIGEVRVGQQHLGQLLEAAPWVRSNSELATRKTACGRQPRG